MDFPWHTSRTLVAPVRRCTPVENHCFKGSKRCRMFNSETTWRVFLLIGKRPTMKQIDIMIHRYGMNVNVICKRINAKISLLIIDRQWSLLHWDSEIDITVYRYHHDIIPVFYARPNERILLSYTLTVE